MQLNSSIPRRQFLQLTAGTAAYTGLSRNVIAPLALGAKSDGRTLNTGALSGKSSQRIVLSGNELSRVKTPVRLSKDASASATISL